MSRSLLRSFLLLVAVVAACCEPGLRIAGVPALAAPPGASCPRGTLRDHALGVALVPLSSWRKLPTGKLPPHTIVLRALPVRGPSYITCAMNNLQSVSIRP